MTYAPLISASPLLTASVSTGMVITDVKEKPAGSETISKKNRLGHSIFLRRYFDATVVLSPQDGMKEEVNIPGCYFDQLIGLTP